MFNQIKNSVANLKSIYNTNDPFEICNYLGITIRFVNYNPSSKAFFVELFENRIIYINSKYIDKSKSILCAHELGHIILKHENINHFESENEKLEREANLFALYLLFDESDFDMKFENMNSYLIKCILDKNIQLIK